MSLDAALAHLKRSEWEKAHAIVQEDKSALGCWAHGIVHILEGDLANARYWYGRAERAFPVQPDLRVELAALTLALEHAQT